MCLREIKMPFENEYASYEPLRRILDSDKINGLTKRLKVHHGPHKPDFKELHLSSKTDLKRVGFKPDMILAIDGSYNARKVENGFPGAEYGYVTIASVLILLERIRELEKQEFINPVDYRETEKASSIDLVIPGCNVIIDDEDSAKSSMRRLFYETLKGTIVFNEGETLLETYEELLKNRNEGRFPKCPHDNCDHNLEFNLGQYTCPSCKNTLYSTDALRLHELMNDIGTCGEMYGQMMLVIERLWLIHILRAFEKRGWLATLRNIVFMMDGPLAVYSTSAWLTKPIIKELERINDLSRKFNNQDIIIIGIEKSGLFANHFEDLDTSVDNIPDIFPKANALLLSDKYIKENIIFSKSLKPYGLDTYFGRKFLYKTKSGYRLVVNLAVYDKFQRNTNTATHNQYPRLKDVMDVLDQVVSNKYDNSVMPIVTAHAEASIPLNLGRRIFEDIAREIRERP